MRRMQRSGAVARRPQQPSASSQRHRRMCLRRFGRRGGVLVLVLVLAGGGAYAVQELTAPDQFPLQAVQFDSELQRVREQDLRAALDPLLDGGFLALDVSAIRRALEDIAWVRSASVRRQWPGTLRVTIVEQEAVAVWNEDALLSSEGEVFAPDPATWPSGLPQMAGPDQRPEKVSVRFASLQSLLDDAGLELQGIAVDARASWSATVNEGAQLLLGREEVESRAARFAAVYPELAETQDGALERADLRYPNGFAIRWTEASGAEQ
ncbi:cell division protein FtsQ/DivIB [Methylonatrum kenyense]|uniref:cell division protein FtsQ/DivIB n=1 Tax=Methylonatrum kenyense TaxID=455253 RepID=UPI0020C0A4E2|nr:cell division protein FtsQ/DivIB [Methylonatrum kenyense]MCK8516295.1 cell division protein FtsQ/DivIB [Methylonatrum kenyense]